MSDIKFDKSTIPDRPGRVLLVTGGTGGIGAEIAVELAKHNPGRILLTGRNAKSAATTTQRIKTAAPSVAVTFVPCDLADLASVKDAANQILAGCDRLDLFLANASIMAKPAGLSADGYEVHFATNHLGHALLTKKLLPLLSHTADLPGSDVRVIYTTSLGWRGGNLDDFGRLRTTMKSAVLGRWIRYGNSKLANMLYARAGAPLPPGRRANCAFLVSKAFLEDVHAVSFSKNHFEIGMFYLIDSMGKPFQPTCSRFCEWHVPDCSHVHTCTPAPIYHGNTYSDLEFTGDHPLTNEVNGDTNSGLELTADHSLTDEVNGDTYPDLEYTAYPCSTDEVSDDEDSPFVRPYSDTATVFLTEIVPKTSLHHLCSIAIELP
ncbi:Uu.00g094010.m01.CDS01 [Anthostomella pinea]|uniref:Uu.00g094010.m01.CDS01 n=1 Tax=Anthostomella pinea TaxID=933095 RepID=A0AAI8VPR6_9PEZI|nr:Uu.00g094010.m01.CDS01 [Anthostomella pinea]